MAPRNKTASLATTVALSADCVVRPVAPKNDLDFAPPGQQFPKFFQHSPRTGLRQLLRGGVAVIDIASQIFSRIKRDIFFASFLSNEAI